MDEVTWEPLRVHTDARGSVFEPLDGQQLRQQRNLHVVVNRPGAVRGNHLHRRAVEYISVSGPARVCYLKGETLETVLVDASIVLCFRFPPGVAHAIENTGEVDQVLVALTDRPHDPQAPDTVSHILIPTEAEMS